MARLDSRELSQWEAFERIEPFGEWRGDVRAAMVCATVMNSQGARPAARTSDYMPQFGPPPEPDPEQEMLALSSLVRSAGQEAEAAKKIG